MIFETLMSSRVLGLPEHVLLAAPSGFDKDAPVILCLHDTGSSARQWEEYGAMARLAEELGVWMIAPDGRDSHFINMEYGPAWNSYLSDGLKPDLQEKMGLKEQPWLVLALGSGSDGALQLLERRPDGFRRVALIGPFGDGGPEDGEKTKKFILADVSGGRSIKGLAALVEEAVSWLCG